MHSKKKKAIEQVRIIQALIRYSEVSKILSTFIKAFETKNAIKEDGIAYLFGNFNLGGTVSGRLSSNSPNLMNLPSTGTIYAKIIKKCFIAPPGYVLAGADFSSLEDKISALTTKDPNKLKVYTDGYDGHCLRAFSYFPDSMEGILPTPDSINSIEQKYPKLRQASKTPTFALTYGGTWKAIMNQAGLSKDESKRIERQYHELYKVSDDWVQSHLQKASQCGYVTGAFSLRLRTPILEQVILDTPSTPYEAYGEGRTAGNMLGQSYGMLNNRAAIEFRERVLASPYKLDILPISHIHDAQYFIIKDDIRVIEWFNKNLIECMEWQDLPELQHPIVKLGGEVQLYYPHWACKITLPNKASQKEIMTLIYGTS